MHVSVGEREYKADVGMRFMVLHNPLLNLTTTGGSAVAVATWDFGEIAVREAALHLEQGKVQMLGWRGWWGVDVVCFGFEL